MTDTQRPNLLDMQAAERIGIPDWLPYHYESIDGGFLLTGAVAPVITRGPRKGRRNWKKRDSATERKIVLTRDEVTQYQAAWSARTGKCHRCVGLGEVFASWSKVSGTKYKPCTACQGTGAKP